MRRRASVPEGISWSLGNVPSMASINARAAGLMGIARSSLHRRENRGADAPSRGGQCFVLFEDRRKGDEQCASIVTAYGARQRGVAGDGGGLGDNAAIEHPHHAMPAGV